MSCGSQLPDPHMKHPILILLSQWFLLCHGDSYLGLNLLGSRGIVTHLHLAGISVRIVADRPSIASKASEPPKCQGLQ